MTWLPLAIASCVATLGQGDAWQGVWADLDALRSGALSATEDAACRTRLDQALQDAEGPRSTLLRASLERLEGADTSSVATRLEALRPTPFSPGELWYLADLLPPGQERASTILAALPATRPLARWQVLLAWNVAVDEARALRLEQGALPIQLLLHERYHDAATAHDLALTHRALGNGQAADRVLADAIRVEQEAGRIPASLWEARGINALGFGDEGRARDYLGRALSGGSSGAALLLSRMELMSNHGPAAREGFRALILDVPPPDWAWRGWGATLLPPNSVPPRTWSPFHTPE